MCLGQASVLENDAGRSAFQVLNASVLRSSPGTPAKLANSRMCYRECEKGLCQMMSFFDLELLSGAGSLCRGPDLNLLTPLYSLEANIMS